MGKRRFGYRVRGSKLDIKIDLPKPEGVTEIEAKEQTAEARHRILRELSETFRSTDSKEHNSIIKWRMRVLKKKE